MTSPDDEYGTPDEENPEWTDEDFLWAVKARDFDGDILKVHKFLRSRENFLRGAKEAGLPREAFLALEPNMGGDTCRACRNNSTTTATATKEPSNDSFRLVASPNPFRERTTLKVTFPAFKATSEQS